VRTRPPDPTAPRPKFRLTRYVLSFAALFALLYGLFITHFEGLLPYFSLLTGAVYVLLNLFYDGFSWTGNILTHPTFAFEITRGCDGITPLILILAAVLPFPVSWRAKLCGLAWAVPILLVSNYLRIVLLALTKIHAPSYFPIMHGGILQPVMVLLTFVLFLLWLLTYGAETH